MKFSSIEKQAINIIAHNKMLNRTENLANTLHLTLVLIMSRMGQAIALRSLCYGLQYVINIH